MNKTPFVRVVMVLRSRLPKEVGSRGRRRPPKASKVLSETLAVTSSKLGKSLPQKSGKSSLKRIEIGLK